MNENRCMIDHCQNKGGLCDSCNDNPSNPLRDMCGSNFKFDGVVDVSCPRRDRCQFNPNNKKWFRCNWCKRNAKLTVPNNLYDQYHRVDMDAHEVLVGIESKITKYFGTALSKRVDPSEFIKEIYNYTADALGEEEKD